MVDAAHDVVIAHPWLLRAPTPNGAPHPRFMCVQRIYHDDVDRA